MITFPFRAERRRREARRPLGRLWPSDFDDDDHVDNKSNDDDNDSYDSHAVYDGVDDDVTSMQSNRARPPRSSLTVPLQLP